MHSIPDAYRSHFTPERLRIKIPAKKGEAAYFSGLKGDLSNCQGVKSVEVNPSTGSVLIFHTVNPDTIASYARNNGLFNLERPDNPADKVNNPSNVKRRIIETFKSIDKGVKEATGGQVDLGTAAFLTLVGVGIYQVAIGNLITPNWYTAFWYALGIILIRVPVT